MGDLHLLLRKNMPKSKFRDWDNVDWSQENKVIAQEYGVSISAVTAQRKKHTNYKTRSYKKVNWGKVDMSKEPELIAEELGIDKGAVYQKRWRDKEPSERKRRVPRSKWLLADWQKSDIELAKQFGVSRQAVNVQRIKFKKLEAINNPK